MEHLHIRRALLYTFEDSDWLKKALTLLGLTFIPIFGWFCILGYQLNIVKNWINREYKLPSFGNLGELFSTGILLFVALFIYNAPHIANVIPFIGQVVSFAWTIVMIFITPYLYIVIATENSLSGSLFNFNKLIKFISENVYRILILLLINVGIAIVGAVLSSPFVIANLILSKISENIILPVLIFQLISFVIIWVITMYSMVVNSSLIGNIYEVWQHQSSSNL